MNPITQITNDAFQNMTLVLPSGSQVTLSIAFVPQQLGWFITNITYQSFILNGVRITNNPNILYSWRNILPFGISCYSKQSREPSQQNDFISQNSVLYLLSSAEVEELTTLYQSGTA